MTIRIIGVLGCGLGICTIVAGLANAAMPNHARDIRMLVAVGIYLLGVSVGTVALRKISAILLVVPLALLGVAAVIGSAINGAVTAVVLNILVSVPLLCSPAVVVWRNRRLLK
jgi:hypothetical protein